MKGLQDYQSLIGKIKSKGYWKVIIRPTEYSKDLIPDLIDCKRLIQESVVSLRGWDYPHIDREHGILNASEDSVYSLCDWDDMSFFEYWRFYKTGQFVHYFAMREDWEISQTKKDEIKASLRTDSEKFLSILSTLFSITEIYEFAARLFGKMESVSGVEIIIELNGVRGRTLFFWDSFGRILFRDYTCTYSQDVVKIELVVSREEIVNNAKELSLRKTIDLFRTAFNWEAVNENIFKEDQRKLLERQL